jgi:hypothetical protein
VAVLKKALAIDPNHHGRKREQIKESDLPMKC